MTGKGKVINGAGAGIENGGGGENRERMAWRS